jgi:hypothetical protein
MNKATKWFGYFGFYYYWGYPGEDSTDVKS